MRLSTVECIGKTVTASCEPAYFQERKWAGQVWPVSANMTKHGLIICLLMGMMPLGGCNSGHPMIRKSKFNCPSDLCRNLLRCTGEDAEFHCPSGPSQDFYGYKPTCWGVWPASSAEWRGQYCGPPMADCVSQPTWSDEDVIEYDTRSDSIPSFPEAGYNTLDPRELPAPIHSEHSPIHSEPEYSPAVDRPARVPADYQFPDEAANRPPQSTSEDVVPSYLLSM